MAIDRAQFKPDTENNALVGSIQLDGRIAQIRLKSPTGELQTAWDNLDCVVTCLREQMPLIETAVREMLSGLGRLDEDTPAGRRKIERLLGQLASSNVSCLIYEHSASVFFDTPRLTGHCIEVQLGSAGKIVCATIAG